ncbi:MAG: hypothetical protein N2Z40_04510 [Caldimicrobium sp.]|nr:hypothetical protein [Caldimicrobium sp.]MCX7613466.1 hypothetical protein [Caldimicrobium sp.]MDW8182962.1 hypothetical protein [Caldimicrobium sp.]
MGRFSPSAIFVGNVALLYVKAVSGPTPKSFSVPVLLPGFALVAAIGRHYRGRNPDKIGYP